MLAYIRGKLATVAMGWVVVEVQGIGYRLHIPAMTPLPGIGQEVKFHTHMVVREDGLQVYGFSREDQMECFLALLDVAGVGPKVALAVVSFLQPEALRLAVAGGDVNQLVKIPGVGKKTAQRILLELKDKLKGPVEGSGLLEAEGPVFGQAAAAEEDAVAALLSLGYGQAEARQAVDKACKKTTPEDVSHIIKYALKELAPAK